MEAKVPKSPFWRSRGSTGILVFLIACVLIGVLFPVLLVIGAMLIIPLPLVFFIAVSPSILMLYGAAYAGGRTTGGWLGAGCGAAFMCALAAIPALQANVALDKRARAAIADDVDQIPQPFRPKNLAVFEGAWWRGAREAVSCDELCIRLLINGEVERFLVATVRDMNAPFTSSLPAIAFRMANQANCPVENLREGHGSVEVSGEDRYGAKRVSPVAVMGLAIASGRCLIRESATLGDADVLLINSTVSVGKSDVSAGFNHWSDTLTIRRLSAQQREGTQWREIYRSTMTRTRYLTPILLPGLLSEGMSLGWGFYRNDVRVNASKLYGGEPDWSHFLQKSLGFRLKLEKEATALKLREELNAALAQTGALKPVTKQLMTDLNLEIIHGRKAELDDIVLLARYLADERTQADWNTRAMLHHLRSLQHERLNDVLRTVASAAFARLRALPSGAGGHADTRNHEHISGIAGIIGALPSEMMSPHKADLEWLAAQYPMRISAYSALVQLGALGADGIPALFSLLDAASAAKARPGKPHPYAEYDWQHNYLAGVLGLCKGGKSMTAALPAFVSRVKSSEISTNGSYWQLALSTLINLGAEDRLVEDLLRPTSPFTRPEHFETALRGARQRPECRY